ncbi:MAG: hypothetical protein JWP25_3596 [Bradyrhizobium sp.]|nr:hypothetical protein [Bradyrhizobium sp.]
MAKRRKVVAEPVDILSRWLGNCRAGQWTPHEAAKALIAELERHDLYIVPSDQIDGG